MWCISNRKGITMKPEKLTFVIHDQSDDYCGMCQQLGPNKYGGPKMHRSLPTQTWNIEGYLESEKTTKWVILCSDCLHDAHKQNDITVRCKDGRKFPNESFFMIRGLPAYQTEKENQQ